MSFRKIIEIDSMLKSSKLLSLEPTVQLITPGSSKGLSEKVASAASDWAECVRPENGKTFILVLALGANEYYGPNRNGDGFKEEELRKAHKTFETNAHVYRSHVNKDPVKALGKVLKSFYNEEMHRVELVLCIDDSKAPDVVSKIHAHDPVAVSMGCRIKYDVCSICGNRAPSRAEYCEHAKFKLNDILPDGRIVYVDNPNPVFFDISIVWRPADKTGYVLKKVALYDERERGAASGYLAEKAAERTTLSYLLQKAADLDKLVRGVGTNPKASDPESLLSQKWLETMVPKILSGYRDIEDKDLKWLSGKNFPKVLASLSSLGIFLTTPEFMNLFFMNVTGKAAPKAAIDKLLSLQGSIFQFMADNPTLSEQILESKTVDIGAEPDEEIVEKVSKYIDTRSLSDDNLIKSALSRRGPLSGGSLETLTYTDPITGEQKITNRAISEQAKQYAKMDAGAKILGIGALSLGAYKGLGHLLGKGLKPLALLPAAVMLGSGAEAISPKEITTDQGVSIPTSTPFYTRTASAKKMTTDLAADYARNCLLVKNSNLAHDVYKTASRKLDPLSGIVLDFESAVGAIGKVLIEA